jgi:uncharacterized protein YecT (DUF1311 family)
MKQAWFFLVAALVASTTSLAYAECGVNASEAEIRRCLTQDLRDSDQRINAVYKTVMAAMDEASQTALRNEQRAWLRRRDKVCALDSRETNREKWLQGIMTDQSKTICVVRFTFGRVAELDALLKSRGPVPVELPRAPATPTMSSSGIAAAAVMPIAFATVDDGYALVSHSAHNKGRWYYEVWIDRGAIASQGEVLLHSGYFATGDAGAIRVSSIRRSHRNAGPIAIGLAIDLEQGFVYIRESGVWNAPPGSSAGMQIKANREWRAGLRSSASLIELFKTGMVRVNLGERGFEYSLPDGYRPFAER